MRDTRDKTTGSRTRTKFEMQLQLWLHSGDLQWLATKLTGGEPRLQCISSTQALSLQLRFYVECRLRTSCAGGSCRWLRLAKFGVSMWQDHRAPKKGVQVERSMDSDFHRPNLSIWHWDKTVVYGTNEGFTALAWLMQCSWCGWKWRND